MRPVENVSTQASLRRVSVFPVNRVLSKKLRFSFLIGGAVDNSGRMHRVRRNPHTYNHTLTIIGDYHKWYFYIDRQNSRPAGFKFPITLIRPMRKGGFWGLNPPPMAEKIVFFIFDLLPIYNIF